MEQTSPAVERARFVVAIVLRFIAAAALLRAVWKVGERIIWDLSDEKLSDTTKLSTWFAIVFLVIVGGGILLALDRVVRLLVPDAPISTEAAQNTTKEPRVDVSGLAASLALAGVRMIGAVLLLIGFVFLAVNTVPVVVAYLHQTNGWGWVLASYGLQAGFLFVAGSFLLVFDRQAAAWIRGADEHGTPPTPDLPA